MVLPSHMLGFEKNKEALCDMETFLTLVIAVGGIATGLGAPWDAVVARRQAQVTERSLAQTEAVRRAAYTLGFTLM